MAPRGSELLEARAPRPVLLMARAGASSCRQACCAVGRTGGTHVFERAVFLARACAPARLKRAGAYAVDQCSRIQVMIARTVPETTPRTTASVSFSRQVGLTGSFIINGSRGLTGWGAGRSPAVTP